MNQEKNSCSWNIEETNFPRQSEIWLVKFPKIKEFSKPYRPCLIISNDLQNEFDNLVTVNTLTTENIEKVKPFEVLIEPNKENGLEKTSKVIVGYQFTIHKEMRFIERLGKIDKETMNKVKKALKLSFDL